MSLNENYRPLVNRILHSGFHKVRMSYADFIFSLVIQENKSGATSV